MTGRRIDRARACDILARCNVPLGADYHTLNTGQVDALISEANAWGYRRPRNANGSRGRYFHAYLQRAAEAAKES